MDIDLFSNDNTARLANDVNNRMEERRLAEINNAKEAYENSFKMVDAIEHTADNTTRINNQLEKVIQNQIEYIDCLKKQLENNEQQLKTLRDIFSSEEKGREFESEIIKYIQEQNGNKHPFYELLKDKGGDVLVSGVTPLIYWAVKTYFQGRGIIIP